MNANYHRSVFIFASAILCTMCVLPALASAQTGMQRIDTTTIVTDNQAPLSPLVGEDVTSTFTISDRNSTALANITGTITVTESPTANHSDDKEILTQAFTSDEHGNVTFQYAFQQEHPYTISLNFTDSNSIPQQAAFSIEPRIVSTNNPSRDATLIGVAFIIGLFGSAALFTFSKKLHNHTLSHK